MSVDLRTRSDADPVAFDAVAFLTADLPGALADRTALSLLNRRPLDPQDFSRDENGGVRLADDDFLEGAASRTSSRACAVARPRPRPV